MTNTPNIDLTREQLEELPTEELIKIRDELKKEIEAEIEKKRKRILSN